MKSMYVTLLGVCFITSCNKPNKAVLSNSTVHTSTLTASLVPLHNVYEPQAKSWECEDDRLSCGRADNSLVLVKSDCGKDQLVSAECGSENKCQKMLQLKK
jgi:hypothetical protein